MAQKNSMTSRQAKAAAGGMKRRRHKNTDRYSTSLYKVMKQVHPECSISKKSMAILNSVMNEARECLRTEARTCMSVDKRQTLSDKDVQTAVRLCLSGELAKHAVSEGSKAVMKYSGSGAGEPKPRAKGAPKPESAERVSHTKASGLLFSVSKSKRFLKGDTNRVGIKAGIFFSAVLEYLAAEVLELAGNAAADFKNTRISPRHILLAIRNDDELSKAMGGTVAAGGVVPKIQSVLLPKTKKPKKTEK